MAGLREQLISGTCGVVWTPPDDASVVSGSEHQLVLRTPDNAMAWLIEAKPLPFALDPADDDVLHEDIIASAHAQFEGELPRWLSPLVEQRRLALRGGPAWRTVRRLTLARGNETLIGHLIVPTATGHVDFRAIARASTTGMRESLLAIKHDLHMPDTPDDAIARSHRAVFDDPAHDAQFPQHPLSIVRRALDQLSAALEVRAPAAAFSAGEIELAPHRCVIASPPRFVPVSADVLQLGPRMLVRVGLEGWYRSLEVWRIDDHTFARRDPRGELCTLARETIEGWVREGAQDIATDVAPIADFDGRPQVEQSVQLVAGKQVIRSVFRWWVEADGVIFRLGTGGPASIDDREHVRVIDAAQASWRRLDPIEPTTPPRRPWWRIW